MRAVFKARKIPGREHVRMALAYLDEIGVSEKQVEITGKSHLRIRWKHEDREFKVIGSFTPKNAKHAGFCMIRDIRHTMENKYGR
jgi:hypothetical protein